MLTGLLQQVLGWLQASVCSGKSSHTQATKLNTITQIHLGAKRHEAPAELRTSWLQLLWNWGPTPGQVRLRLWEECRGSTFEPPCTLSHPAHLSLQIFVCLLLAPAWVSNWLSGVLSWRAFQHWVVKIPAKQVEKPPRIYWELHSGQAFRVGQYTIVLGTIPIV